MRFWWSCKYIYVIICLIKTWLSVFHFIYISFKIPFLFQNSFNSKFDWWQGMVCFLGGGGHRKQPQMTLMMFMFSLLMIVSLIVKSLNVCLKSPLVKVLFILWPRLAIFNLIIIIIIVCYRNEFVIVTAVESGWRALQYLGLDQEKTSPDFVNVCVIIIIIIINWIVICF